MKVLHVITGLATGGAERALHTILAGGISQSFECGVVSLSDKGAYGDRIQALGVPVWTLGLGRGKVSVRALIQLRNIVRKFQPDIIQGWMYHGNMAASAASFFSRGNCRVIWNVRASLYDLTHQKTTTSLLIRLSKFIKKNVYAVVYNSKVSKEQHEKFGFVRSGIVIPNGFDLERWKPSEESRQLFRNELGLPEEGAILIGHVARFHPMKGHEMFLEALAIVMRSDKKLHCILAGRNVNFSNTLLAPYLSDLPRDRLHILGERSDVERIMSGVDIFCLSSLWGEGFPNVIGEAMASGVPCVCTDVGDSTHIVSNKGVIVHDNSPAALANGLRELTSMAGPDRLELGRAARERIRTNYSLDSVVSQYCSLYMSMFK